MAGSAAAGWAEEVVSLDMGAMGCSGTASFGTIASLLPGVPEEGSFGAGSGDLGLREFG